MGQSTAARSLQRPHDARECRDPSRPDKVHLPLCRSQQHGRHSARSRLRQSGSGNWLAQQERLDQRSEILGRVAAELRKARGNVHVGCPGQWRERPFPKAIPKSPRRWTSSNSTAAPPAEFSNCLQCGASGRGVVAVVPPWNFPIAIPCGGIAAALAAGNTVILKPASDAVLIAWELCKSFWRGGVSKNALQFVPCSGSGAGAKLVSHPDVDAVILTGGTETAMRMLEKKPHLRLFAETGGKNASIITALSDRELAIKHVVHSAFSHSGQKCSATSLLLLEREVYEDEGFKRMFCDAVRSIVVGSAWDLPSRMGPVIRAPGGELEAALKTLEPGESWAVMPKQVNGNPNLWTPGVKWGVSRGSFTHLTEFFGPVLAVMPFDTLDEAIDIVNQTGYGLTSGIHSLDEREIDIWKSKIHAGNLYINRSTVGAIVLRQPFGGMGKSCFGPGMKAGGPNYVAQFMKFAGQSPFKEAIDSYEHWWREEFKSEHDHFRLLGQDNIRRYLPFETVRVRLSPADSNFEIQARVAAAGVTGALVILSVPPERGKEVVRLLFRLVSRLLRKVMRILWRASRVILRMRQSASATRRPSGCRKPCALLLPRRAFIWPMNPCFQKDASNCSGTSANRASATTTTATGISAHAGSALEKRGGAGMMNFIPPKSPGSHSHAHPSGGGWCRCDNRSPWCGPVPGVAAPSRKSRRRSQRP